MLTEGQLHDYVDFVLLLTQGTELGWCYCLRNDCLATFSPSQNISFTCIKMFGMRSIDTLFFFFTTKL